MQACCGAGGTGAYNFNLKKKCGEAGASVCSNPSAYVSWDGIHMTEAAYRMVAELLHNALRHAHATEVQVEVRRLPTSLRLLVADNGRGFDPHRAAPRRGGLGLRGVHARAGYLRGQVVVTTQPGQGTRIVIEVPITS